MIENDILEFMYLDPVIKHRESYSTAVGTLYSYIYAAVCGLRRWPWWSVPAEVIRHVGELE